MPVGQAERRKCWVLSHLPKSRVSSSGTPGYGHCTSKWKIPLLEKQRRKYPGRAVGAAGISHKPEAKLSSRLKLVMYQKAKQTNKQNQNKKRKRAGEMA